MPLGLSLNEGLGVMRQGPQCSCRANCDQNKKPPSMTLCTCNRTCWLYRPQRCFDKEVERCDQKGKDAQCAGPP